MTTEPLMTPADKQLHRALLRFFAALGVWREGGIPRYYTIPYLHGSGKEIIELPKGDERFWMINRQGIYYRFRPLEQAINTLRESVPNPTHLSRQTHQNLGLLFEFYKELSTCYISMTLMEVPVYPANMNFLHGLMFDLTSLVKFRQISHVNMASNTQAINDRKLIPVHILYDALHLLSIEIPAWASLSKDVKGYTENFTDLEEMIFSEESFLGLNFHPMMFENDNNLQNSPMMGWRAQDIVDAPMIEDAKHFGALFFYFLTTHLSPCLYRLFADYAVQLFPVIKNDIAYFAAMQTGWGLALTMLLAKSDRRKPIVIGQLLLLLYIIWEMSSRQGHAAVFPSNACKELDEMFSIIDAQQCQDILGRLENQLEFLNRAIPITVGCMNTEAVSTLVSRFSELYQEFSVRETYLNAFRRAGIIEPDVEMGPGMRHNL